MKTEQLQKQVSELMDGRKAHRQTRIVEIKTKEHTRRGLLRGVQTDGILVFSWIPDLAKGVKSIENPGMDVITVICSYKPEDSGTKMNRVYSVLTEALDKLEKYEDAANL